MRQTSDRVTRWEENFIAILMAALVITAFTQVIARYVFNTGWTGALEFQRILFAWLILFGMAYGVKMGIHLGVDAVIRQFPKSLFKFFALFGAFCVLLYGVVLLYADWLAIFGADTKGGAIAYWTRFYQRSGIGLEDIRYPEWAQDMFGLQERVPRWIAYIILPVGLFLLCFRALQALVGILRGDREQIVAGHEAEDLVEEHRGAASGDDVAAGAPPGDPPAGPANAADDTGR